MAYSTQHIISLFTMNDPLNLIGFLFFFFIVIIFLFFFLGVLRFWL